MVRRGSEPDEVLGPVLDGHDQLARLEMFLTPEENAEPEPEVEISEPEEPQIVLLCGSRDPAAAVAALASDCGFVIEAAVTAPLAADSALAQLAAQTYLLGPEENIAEICAIDRNHYVCVFEEDAGLCEQYLGECLSTNAAYIGAWASAKKADAIFDDLKQAGAPDAELAAVCCPMGLAIGAETPAQEAVAVVAELMAARTGALKRLRYAD